MFAYSLGNANYKDSLIANNPMDLRTRTSNITLGLAPGVKYRMLSVLVEKARFPDSDAFSKNVVTGSSLGLAGRARTISEELVTTFIETTVLYSALPSLA
ncbi:hypothetical protein CROQUDRAFT_93781 [Cronartium quercuum f. sp. fusiforme G11]|uniref:Uncharacterized protein n=1 Tax=Cronartium quercuum f. sp. fusiforme G11 TaxID=708437 RepID=A0A9P6NGG5_9BASI|nr:hypothetical protein CROQUDRAFT_93781 [Cronartium quercuum f. sp. fusiforme G11]